MTNCSAKLNRETSPAKTAEPDHGIVHILDGRPAKVGDEVLKNDRKYKIVKIRKSAVALTIQGPATNSDPTCAYFPWEVTIKPIGGEGVEIISEHIPLALAFASIGLRMNLS